MKLTVVTAVFNAIKSGNRENLREKKIGVENRCTKDGLSFSVDAFVSNASDGVEHSSIDAIETIASTRDESGALIERALPEINNSTERAARDEARAA